MKRSSEIRSSEKKSFDQMPNLTETFDQVKRSSEIRSSECFPFVLSLPMQFLHLRHKSENRQCIELQL